MIKILQKTLSCHRRYHKIANFQNRVFPWNLLSSFLLEQNSLYTDITFCWNLEHILASFWRLIFWGFFVCFIRLFLEAIIGFPMKMSLWEPLILETAYRCWVRSPRPTSPSSVRPGQSGWSLHRPASCIIFSVRGLPYLLEAWT